MVHGTTIEIIWTILPSFVSMFIAIPSFVLLYSMDQVRSQLAMFNDGAEVVSLSAPQLVAYNFGPNRPDPVISRIGDPRRVGSNHSGYVTKFIPRGGAKQRILCGFIEAKLNCSAKQRPLDNRVVVPAKTSFCMIITPADVLYSWAVPFPGAKRDARSEIRGTNYAFMPTVVEVVSLNEYLEWVSDHQQ
ncbi:hypothetical protein KP509_1Z261900 [Ceratopteris richardii]|nr:hypothetical protein KP509_1Z261900 [Ceratopteris richardii]